MMTEQQKAEREEFFLRAVLVRRIKNMGHNVIVSPFVETKFYWQLLNELERGGN